MDKDYKEIDRVTFSRQNYNASFCCFDMDSILNRSESIYKIKYDASIREYFLESEEGYICAIQFCPWCASQLPTSLRDEWYDILEQKYNLDPWIPEQREKIPT